MSRPPLPALSLAAALLAAPAIGGEREECRLALVLALDVSGSVDAAEDRLQRDGLAAALLAPEVVRAFLADGPVALYAFEWAGDSTQTPLLPGWEMIEGEQDLLRVAGALGRTQRTGYPFMEDGTAVGAALVHAAEALAAAPDCRERTVDVSGDGMSNEGPEPRAVLATAYAEVTVNALVIDTPQPDPLLDALLGGDTLLADWFAQSVLHGPDAFLVQADGYEDYERAMRTKLLRELGLPLVGGSPRAGNGA